MQFWWTVALSRVRTVTTTGSPSLVSVCSMLFSLSPLLVTAQCGKVMQRNAALSSQGVGLGRSHPLPLPPLPSPPPPHQFLFLAGTRTVSQTRTASTTPVLLGNSFSVCGCTFYFCPVCQSWWPWYTREGRGIIELTKPSSWLVSRSGFW